MKEPVSEYSLFRRIDVSWNEVDSKAVKGKGNNFSQIRQVKGLTNGLKTQNEALIDENIDLYKEIKSTDNSVVNMRFSNSVYKWDSFLILAAAAAAAKSLQSCLTLCNPRDGSLPGSPIPGILQARTLEWVAMSFSNACEWKVKAKLLSHVQLFAIPWTAAHQSPLFNT